MEQCSKCLIGLDNPVYIWVIFVISCSNLTYSIPLHCGHSVMVLLCVPHRHAGVYLDAKSSAESHYGFFTSSSNSVKNTAKLGSPSYVGSGRN